MKTIEELTDSLVRQTCELMVAVRKVKECNYVDDVQDFEMLTDRLEMLSEKYACSVRDFSVLTFTSNRCETFDKAAQVQGIEIHKDNNTVIVDLPQLLPRKKGKQHDYICEPLRYKFEEISETKNLKIRDKAVVCIIHIYDNVNKKARCYDYDNLESKKILDIISLFTLTDDAPEYCDVYQTVKLGDCDKTRVVIMPADEFPTKILSMIF